MTTANRTAKQPTPAAPTETKHTRDTKTGRYAHSRLDALCLCGHVLGAHTAAVVGVTPERKVDFAQRQREEATAVADRAMRERDALRAQLATAHEALRVLRDERDEARSNCKTAQETAVRALATNEQFIARCTELTRLSEEALNERDESMEALSQTAAEAQELMRQNDALRAELTALRTLAEQSQRATSDVERLLAASIVVARLIRPEGK